MTTYYVSPSGSDANNGLGPDASHASNKPFLTIGKLLATSGALGDGDTAYVAPGTYRQIVVVGITSPTVETKILADPANAQGFKDGSGVRLAGGDVIWTAYTTNDKTAPSASPLLTTAQKNFLTFENFILIGGSTSVITNGVSPDSHHITFRNCFFYGMVTASANVVYLTPAANAVLTWEFDACDFFAPAAAAVRIDPVTSATADWDIVVVLKNCRCIAPAGHLFRAIPSGAAAFKPGGVRIDNCTQLGGANLVRVATNWSTTIPCLVYNSAICAAVNGLEAVTVGQIVENFNIISAVTPRTNVTAGANSISGNPAAYAVLMELGQSFVSGRQPRPFGQPTAGSPLLGFGAQAGGPAIDRVGLTRPAGGASPLFAVGALERGNTAVRETGTVRTGANAYKIGGPGALDLVVPVDPVSTTVSVWTRWDGTYAGTKPQLIVLGGSEIGVADATDTATGSSGAWEELSLTFTPTAAGFVTVRFQSNDTNGAGATFWDDFRPS